MPNSSSHEKGFFRALSILTLAPARAVQVYPQLCELAVEEFAELVSLAASNHVVLRALVPLQRVAEEFADDALVSRCQAHIQQEQVRITNAVQHLSPSQKRLNPPVAPRRS